MSEIYPIRFDGNEAGTLEVRPDGLFTEFRARCADPGRLIRLSVYGEGGEGYLGVMEPNGGELLLVRRISRAGMRDFPFVIRYAGETGRPEDPPEEAETISIPESSPPEMEPEENPEAASRFGEAAAPAREESPDCTREEAEAEREAPGTPAAPESPEEGTDLIWYQAGDGSLFTRVGERSYRAIPMAAWGLPMDHALEQRSIDGVQYAIFVLDEGKII